MEGAEQVLILVVEDDPVAARLIQAQLSAPGRELQHAATLQQALAFCRRQRPDLLLLDHSLPDGSAEGLLDTLATLPGGIPPFIVVTGAGDEHLAVAMMKRGARDYLVKTPQFIFQLPAAVSRVLRELESQVQLAAAQQALQQSQLECARLVDNSPDIIARFDHAGRHLFVNRSIERYVERSVAEIVGRSHEELGMPDALCCVWRQRLEQAFTTGAIQTFQFEFDGSAGSTVFESRLVPERDATGEVVTVLGLVRDITQQQRAKRDAERRKRRLEAIFDASYAGIIMVDSNGIIQFTNRRMADLFGAAELVGMSYPQLVAPEQQAEGTQRMLQLIRGEIDHVLLERLYLRQDGSSFWGLLSGRRLLSESGEFEALVGIITDISDRKRAEQQLQESQSILLQAQALGKIASFDWDLASGHIDWTPQGFALLERAPESLDQTIAEWFGFVHPDDRPLLQQTINTALAVGSQADIEYRLLMPDGRCKPVITFGEVQRGADGTPQRIVGLTQDLTERKLIEQHLAEARDRAEAASRAKSAFLANMSHELRTPLNGILGMLQLLELGNLDREHHEYARIATSSGWSLLRLIDDLLDLSRIEAGRISLQEEPFDLHDCIAEVLTLFLQTARDKGIVLCETIAASVPPLLLADATRVRQILFNLVGNAVKFTACGEVRVSAECLPAPAGRLHLRLMVRDTGIGMSEEMLRHAGEPFTQAEGTYRRQYQGAGLGLSIVKRLAVLMKGEMQVASRLGEGTQVTVELLVGCADDYIDPASLPRCLHS